MKWRAMVMKSTLFYKAYNQETKITLCFSDKNQTKKYPAKNAGYLRLRIFRTRNVRTIPAKNENLINVLRTEDVSALCAIRPFYAQPDGHHVSKSQLCAAKSATLHRTATVREQYHDE